MTKKTKVTFLIDEDLYIEYKKFLRDDGRTPTSDLNKHIRDYVFEMRKMRKMLLSTLSDGEHPLYGSTNYRKDIVYYIIEKGSVSKDEIKNIFKDCSEIELNLTIEKTKAIFKNSGNKGIYIELKDNTYSVSESK